MTMRLPSILKCGLALPAALLLTAGLAHAQTDLSGNISDDTTGPLLSGQVYHIVSSVTVPEGKTLTMQSGVIVKAYASQYFYVRGTLLGYGAAGSGIVLTSILDDSAGGDTNGDGPSSGSPGDWRGLHFYATAAACDLDYVTVRYSGTAGTPGIELRGTSPSFDNCTIRDCLNDGLDLNGLDMGVSVSNCAFLDNGRYAVANVPLQEVPGFTNNSASGNTSGNYLRITSFTPSSNLVIGTQNVLGGALVTTGSITVPATFDLTLEAGVVMKWASGASLYLHGTLTCPGTSSEPVVFTAMEDDDHGGDTNLDGPSSGAPGSWRGLYFYADGDGSSLTETIVRYGGTSGAAGIELNGTEITLDDCTIRDCLYDGLDLNGGSVGTTVSGCSFVDNGRYAVASVPMDAVPDFSGNSASGNASGDFLRVTVPSPTASLTLDPDSILGGALVMTTSCTVGAGITLNLNPGVITKWPAGASVYLHGTLITNGTSAEPVVFTVFADDDHGGDTNLDGPSSGTPGSWRGLYFYSDADGSALTETIVRYGGTSGAAGIELVGADVTLDNCTIRDGLYDGLDLNVSTVGATISGCSIVDNGRYAVNSVALDAVPGFSGNSASGNASGDYMRVTAPSPSDDLILDTDSILEGVLVMTTSSTISSGITLTMNPGVVTKWPTGATVYVHGELNVLGDVEDPVVFTSFYDDEIGGDTDMGGGPPVAGDWRGLHIYAGATGIIQHALVRYTGTAGTAGVTTYSPALALTDVRVDHGAAEGFELHEAPSVAQRLCAYNCATQGIRLQAGAFTLRQATCVACGVDGILKSGTFTGPVKDCIAWNNTSNFTGFAAGELRYSNGSATPAGSDGNIDTDPWFVDEVGGDLHLEIFSPCVDAGDPTSPLDPDLTRADMGAFYYNSCRPQRFCESKTNSLGCTPAIDWSGYGSLTGSDTLYITANQVLGQTTGYLLWGLTPNPPGASTGGYTVIGTSRYGLRLCMLQPEMSSALNSGGNTGACDGTFNFHFSQALMSSYGLTTGTSVYAQYIYSDPAHPDGSGYGYTDAIAFTLCP